MFDISLFNYCKNEGEADNYVFKDKYKFEFVLFKGGFIIAKRNSEPSLFDFYSPEDDTIKKELGYQRVARKYVFRKSINFIYNKSSIIKNFKLK